MFAIFTTSLEEQRARYFLWVPVFLGAGAGAYFALRFEPVLPVGISLTILATLGLLWTKTGRIVPKLAFAALFCLCLGLMLASYRAHSVAAPVLSEPFFGAVEGRVVKLDRSQSNRLRITFDDVILYGIEPDMTPERVRVTLPQKDAIATIGARALIYARLEGPGPPVEPDGFDFRRWAWFHRLGGVGYALGPLLPSSVAPAQSALMTLTNTRYHLADFIRSEIPGNNGAFAAAILTGERSAIDPALLEDLRASNLAHLLAISGLHMGLLTGFIFGLFRYGIALVPNVALRTNGKKIGAAMAIPAGLAYLLLSGASIATQRAYVMVLVVLIAVLLDRPAFTLRAVALAALIVMIIAPESVTQVGFQMSFAATIGLVAGFEALRHTQLWRRPVVGWQKFAKGVFSVGFSSAVAGAATAPFAAFHFNQFAQYGLVANLFAVPLMGMMVMPAAIVALILAPIGLSAPFFWIAGAGIGLILNIAHVVAGLKGAVVLVASGNMIVLPIFASGCLIAVLWIGRFKLVGCALAGIAIVLWMGSKRPDILIDDTGRLAGVMTEEGRALSKAKGNGFIARSWLTNDGDRSEQKQAGQREWAAASLVEWSDASPGLEALCLSHKVVLAPDSNAPSDAACLIVDETMLKREGAIALYFKDNGIIAKGSRSQSGDRLWTKSARQ